jgi:hypothetical protein
MIRDLPLKVAALVFAGLWVVAAVLTDRPETGAAVTVAVHTFGCWPSMANCQQRWKV